MASKSDGSSVAVIPARGGSKAIPGKNLALVAGKPLLAWTIVAAQQTKTVRRVLVSTDDPRIAQCAREWGAEVVERPAEISGDSASSELALLHSLQSLRKQEGYEARLTVFLQCTSPLTLAEDIDGTVQALLDEDADSALAVTPFHYFLWRKNEKGDAVGINHDKRVRLRRQDREPQYLETGAVYVMRTEGFLKAKHRFFGKTAMYVMPPERCLEIDEPVDLEIAEVLLRRRIQQEKLNYLPERPAALVLDFDGVMTDNRVLVSEDGQEAVACGRSDGLGIARLNEAGIPVLVLSSERNPVVAARCKKLGIPCLHAQADKAAALKQWADGQGIDLAKTVYVGNDLNDRDCLQLVGCPVVVADAHPSVTRYATIILDSKGGHGAVREICDMILQRLGEER